MYGYFLSLMLLPYVCAPPGEVIPYPDNSLDLEQYRRIGVPAVDAPWTATDYQTAFRILDQLHAEDKTALPRADSPHSGQLFARMTQLEHFLASENIGRQLLQLHTARPLAERMRLYYAEPTLPHERFGREVLQLLVFEFQIVSEIQQTTQSLLRELPAERQTDVPRPRPSENADMLGALLLVLEDDHQRFPEAALSDFLNQLYFVLPEYLDVAQREEVHQRLIFLENRFPYPTGRALIAELRGAL